jgi:excisionase family DNA binding protein
MPAAQRKAAPPPERVDKPISVGGLAVRLGVPRQRIYTLIEKGQIRALPMSGGLVVSSDEANRVIDAAIRVDTNDGRSRVVFNFI